jgi:putative acyl-CoA dehydrogenase
LAERLALALQGSLVVRHGPAAIGQAFILSRLTGDHGQNFGTLSPDVNLSSFIDWLTTEPFLA